MTNASINVRIDENLKKQFETFCDEIGISMSAAMTLFIKKTVNENRIPFAVGTSSFNSETERAIEDARKGIGLSRGFDSVSDLMSDLYADD